MLHDKESLRGQVHWAYSASQPSSELEDGGRSGDFLFWAPTFLRGLCCGRPQLQRATVQHHNRQRRATLKCDSRYKCIPTVLELRWSGRKRGSQRFLRGAGWVGGWTQSRREGAAAAAKVVDGFIFTLEERWCKRREAGADVSTGHSVYRGRSEGPSLWVNCYFSPWAAPLLLKPPALLHTSVLSGGERMFQIMWSVTRLSGDVHRYLTSHKLAQFLSTNAEVYVSKR